MNNGKYLTFDDVLLVPRYNGFKSRKDVDISVKLGPYTFKAPIISSNMDTITSWRMASTMANLGCLGILHRFNSIDDNVMSYITAKKHTLGEVGVSIGVNEGLDRLEALYKNGARIFCIDVAHGHSNAVGLLIKEIKLNFKDVFVIAGNVATYEGAAYLADCGADAVKVGIGGGCFIKGTSVATNKGNKPIEKIQIGDSVLTHTGKYKKVKAISKREENETIIDINGIKCTKNHQFYVIEKKYADNLTDEKVSMYAKWIEAELLSDDYFLLKIKND